MVQLLKGNMYKRMTKLANFKCTSSALASFHQETEGKEKRKNKTTHTKPVSHFILKKGDQKAIEL